MIRPNDLREGNLIFAETGLLGLEVHVVTGQDIADICFGKVASNSIAGIELTPEWLERMGFESQSKSEDVYKYTIGPDHYILIGKLRKNSEFTMYELWFTDSNGDAAFPYALPELKYVHKLQNLYYSLTGEELTIKP